MTDPTFQTRFDALKTDLDDPDTRFIGGDMVEALEALLPLAGDGTAAETRLRRELAVLEGKRGDVACIAHAARAAALNATHDVLTGAELFWMHYVTADTANMWGTGAQTLAHAAGARPHLDAAETTDMHRDSLDLYEASGRIAAGDVAAGHSALMALDTRLLARDGPTYAGRITVLTRLTDACNSLGDHTGRIEAGRTIIETALAAGDPGRATSGSISLARMCLDAGDTAGARAATEGAATYAQAASPSTRTWAAKERQDLLAEIAASRPWWRRLLGLS
ncbi:hypothetical protein [Jannaschia marina]|uniref:hypothetical protein n=1 Tax=Jannaschia marina TaxID=2741674 RepID=UPI0015CAFD12|nr:hypothetical protein [Jannaschia marina]